MAIFGLQVGAQFGPRYGIPSPFASGGPTWSVDGTSGKGVPLTQADWNAVFSVAGVAAKTVNQCHGLQDASGNPVATVGTNYTAYGGLAYQQAVTGGGWSRLCIHNDVASAKGFGLAAGTGPNAATQSVLYIVYHQCTSAAGATRTVSAGSNAGTNDLKLQIVQTTGLLRVRCASVVVDGASDHAVGVRPYVLVYNRTAGTVKGYSDLEKVTGTYSAAVTDVGGKGFPANATIVGDRGDYLWCAAFAGAAAEWSDADVKAVLQTLGWTIPWS